MARTVSQTINLLSPDQSSKYITRIDDAGIKVHPYNSTSGAADTQNYIRINSSAVDVFQTGISVASFGETTRMGKTGESRLELDYHSMQLIDKEGSPYFYVSDLRDKNDGYRATLTETFKGDGTQTAFSTSLPLNMTVSVIDSSNPSNTYIVRDAISYGTYTFAAPPADGATVTIKYKTASTVVKAYTFGLRADDSLNNLGALSVVEGSYNIASAYASHAEGNHTTASGRASHTEGYYCEALGKYSHAEGSYTVARGQNSHAEGGSSTSLIGYVLAAGVSSRAEGQYTTARGTASHAEGQFTTASGHYSHAEGESCTASERSSHAEGNGAKALGRYSHAQNFGTIAQRLSQTAIGEYNIEDTGGTDETTRGDYAFIIGNGTSSTRSNALAVTWDGDIAMMSAGTLGTTDYPASAVIIGKTTTNTNTFVDDNPKLIFQNVNASQNISLTFTDYDSVQAPASLTLNGNQGGEYFIAPNIKATSGFYTANDRHLYLNQGSSLDGCGIWSSNYRSTDNVYIQADGYIALYVGDTSNAPTGRVYVQYTGTSVTGTLSASGNISSTAGYIISTKNGNTMSIGSQNSSFGHFINSTSIPFYFNNTIALSGDLGTTSYPATRAYIGAGGIHLKRGTNATFTLSMYRTANGTLYIGNSDTPIQFNGTTVNSNKAITVNSDQRLKENIIPVDNRADDLLLKLKPIQYTWARNVEGYTPGKEFGFIAQEVDIAMKSVGYTDDKYNMVIRTDSPQGYLALSYTSLIPMLVHLCQTQQNEIDELKKEITKMKEESK